jgi:hypothetical protein
MENDGRREEDGCCGYHRVGVGAGMKRFILSGSIFFFLLTAAMILAQPFVSSGADQTGQKPAASNLLLEKHAVKKIGCQGCHPGAPPHKAVKTETCLKCHGKPEALAQLTAKLALNPHDSPHDPPSDMKCENCHHVHKLSENSCLQCHDENVTKERGNTGKNVSN